MPKKSAASIGETPYGRLYSMFIDVAPLILTLVGRHPEDFKELRVYQRGEGDCLGVLKRYGNDGAPEVIFGNGVDFVACLLALEGSMRANRWRQEDPPPWEADQ